VSYPREYREQIVCLDSPQIQIYVLVPAGWVTLYRPYPADSEELKRLRHDLALKGYARAE